MKIDQRNGVIWLVAGLIIMLIVLYRLNGDFEQTEKMQITIITKSKYGENWETISKGIQAGANEFGVTVKLLAPDSNKDVEAQKTLLQAASTNGTDAIIIAPIDYKVLNETMEDLSKQGIPMITMVSRNERYPNKYYIGLDHYETGKKIGRVIVKEIGTKGVVSLMGMVELSDDNVMREKGIRDYLSEHTSISIVEKVENITGEFSITMHTNNMLKKHPEINAFVGIDEEATRGICLALKNKKPGLTVIGYGSSHDIVNNLELKVIDKLVVPNYFGIGYMAIKNTVDYMNKKEFDEITYIEPMVIDLDSVYDENVQKVLFSIQ
ncbi:MAG: hypothetical protein CVU84_14785 [Firmicutes bacterium HGW-Firmicutes-1]|jgi:ribose transport system substrate-binding protein|nr:MAG: hypothetical protein CVU84_14785 [Firmicutes bacterium HGW-Firmicutes-1]